MRALAALALCASACTNPRNIHDLPVLHLDMAMGPGAPDLAGADLTESDPCSDRAKLVYVVDENNVLSSFAPDTLTFTDIGTLGCPAQGGDTPFSMAVDRNAVAWVLYSSGTLFKVDTSNASCTATTFDGASQGFPNFGMGFVADGSGSSISDTLYVAGGDMTGTSAHVGSLDLTSLKVAVIGSVGGSPELTGTGDSKLYGFFPDPTSPRVSQLDRTNAQPVMSYPLAALAGQPAAWAFAFWGGDFWIFLQRATDPSTIVWHLQANGAVTQAVTTQGRTIVGAGVSTCAPTTIM